MNISGTVLTQELIKEGEPPQFQLRMPGAVTLTFDILPALALRDAVALFIGEHAPLILRDGTSMERLVEAHFSMPHDFLGLNIPSGTGH